MEDFLEDTFANADYTNEEAELENALLALEKANFELRQENQQLRKEKDQLHESLNILMMEQTEELIESKDHWNGHSNGQKTRMLHGEHLIAQDADFVLWCKNQWLKISTRPQVPRLFLRTLARLKEKQKI